MLVTRASTQAATKVSRDLAIKRRTTPTKPKKLKKPPVIVTTVNLPTEKHTRAGRRGLPKSVKPKPVTPRSVLSYVHCLEREFSRNLDRTRELEHKVTSLETDIKGEGGVEEAFADYIVELRTDIWSLQQQIHLFKDSINRIGAQTSTPGIDQDALHYLIESKIEYFLGIPTDTEDPKPNLPRNRAPVNLRPGPEKKKKYHDLFSSDSESDLE